MYELASEGEVIKMADTKPVHDKTRNFNFGSGRHEQLKMELAHVYNALAEKGYDPVDQIVGYIVTEDPTYITTNRNARSMIMRIDKYELLKVLVEDFLEIDGD